MDFLDIVALSAWSSEVLSLVYCSVDQFTPVFSHLLFMNYSQVLAEKLWVDRDDFDVLVPQRENLSRQDVDVVN
jgi:hypothetical protein